MLQKPLTVRPWREGWSRIQSQSYQVSSYFVLMILYIGNVVHVADSQHNPEENTTRCPGDSFALGVNEHLMDAKNGRFPRKTEPLSLI